MTKRKQSVIEGGLILTLALVIIKLAGWLYRVQLGSILDDYGYGLYSSAYSVFNLVFSLTVMGFPIAMSKIVSLYASQNRYKDIRSVVRAAKKFFAITGIVGTLLILAVAKPYTGTLQNGQFVFWGIITVAPSIFFCCLMSVYRGYNQGMSNMTPTAVSQVVEVLFKVASGLGGALVIKTMLVNEFAASQTVFGMVMASAEEANPYILSFSSAGAMFGITISTLAGYLYLVFMHWRKGDGITKRQINESAEPHSDRFLLKQIIWFALPIALSMATASIAGVVDNSIINGIAALIKTNWDTLNASHGNLLSELIKGSQLSSLPTSLFGVYNKMLTIVTLIPTFTAAFGMSALPLVSASWAAKNRLETKKNIDAAMRITMLIAAPIGFGLTFLSGPIAKFIYVGQPVATAIGAPILQMLGIVGICTAASTVVGSLVQGIGRPWITLVMTAGGLIIKTLSNYFLVAVPELNIKAAPIGSFFCYLFILVSELIVLLHTTKVKMHFTGVFLKPLLAGLLTGVFSLLGFNLISMVVSSNTVATIGGIGLGAVVYIFALGILKGIERDDILSMPGGKKLAGILEKLHIIR